MTGGAGVSEVTPDSNGEVCALRRSHRERLHVELTARSWCTMRGEITRHLQFLGIGVSDWRFAAWPIIACVSP